METLPAHLQKYIVKQDYSRYSSVDQACWRYVLRQLKSYLSQHAHPSYVSGLAATGIEVDEIPRIEKISAKLERFGWRALPVSGFIPPAAFMELQSLGVLPIAADMRSLEHLDYTPAPDIVHEAAGHAPLLADPEYAGYLREYATVARKAILSTEDLQLYDAIRVLSDLKEHPDATSEAIAQAQHNLDRIGRSMSHVSEGSELSRMNWWTAEYGLIGDLKDPKIFGAGLLSSVGESRWCLGNKVRKIELSLDCLQTTYDITEPQPQLYVARDFRHLSEVLQQMAKSMAFQTGGVEGLDKILRAGSVNCVQLNSGLQISGKLIHHHLGQYLQMQGPTQLAFADHELPGQGPQAHADGFGGPIGAWRNFPGRCPSTLSPVELEAQGVRIGQVCRINYESGVEISGLLQSELRQGERLLLLTFTECKVQWQNKVLFAPEWGRYDLMLGQKVTSVFGGPADRAAFPQNSDFKAMRVPSRQISAAETQRRQLYQNVREWRIAKTKGSDLESGAKVILEKTRDPQDWLLILEVLELLHQSQASQDLTDLAHQKLQEWSHDPKLKTVIADGLNLVGHA